MRPGELDLAVARSILEARLAVGPGVAALAAERGGPALPALLTDTLDALAATDDGPVGDSSGRCTRWSSGTRSSTPPTRSCSA